MRHVSYVGHRDSESEMLRVTWTGNRCGGETARGPISCTDPLEQFLDTHLGLIRSISYISRQLSHGRQQLPVFDQ